MQTKSRNPPLKRTSKYANLFFRIVSTPLFVVMCFIATMLIGGFSPSFALLVAGASVSASSSTYEVYYQSISSATAITESNLNRRRDIYLHLSTTQSGLIDYQLSYNKVLSSSSSDSNKDDDDPIDLMWEDVRSSGGDAIYLHIAPRSSSSSSSSGIAILNQLTSTLAASNSNTNPRNGFWNETKIVTDIFTTTRRVVASTVTSTTMTTASTTATNTTTATIPATTTSFISGSSSTARPSTTTQLPTPTTTVAYTEVTVPPTYPNWNYFIDEKGKGEGLTADRLFPNYPTMWSTTIESDNKYQDPDPSGTESLPFTPVCVVEVVEDSAAPPTTSNTTVNSLSTTTTSVPTATTSPRETHSNNCTPTALRVSLGPHDGFRLWHLHLTAAHLRIPINWIGNWESSGAVAASTTDSSGSASSSSASSSSSESSAKKSSAAGLVLIPVEFTTELPSSIKQNTMFVLCCAIGIGSIVTGGGGWIGLTSLQTLLLSVGEETRECSEPFTYFYFHDAYAVLVAPTTLASKGIASNYSLTIGIILLCVVAHVLVATIKKKISRVSFWSAARWCYFPMPFLIALTYLWIRLNSEAFLGIAGVDQTPLVRVSFALSWAVVVLIAAYIWYDALSTGHDGYYLLTTVLSTPSSSKQSKATSASNASAAIANNEEEDETLSKLYSHRDNAMSDNGEESMRLRKNQSISSNPSMSQGRRRQSVGLSTMHPTSGRHHHHHPHPSPTTHRVESVVVRISYKIFGRFAWFIIPEGSWPLTRGYGVCRGLFRDNTCSFAIFTLLILCVIAGVSNSASCEALYLNSAIVQIIYLLLFLVFRPFRIPILNALWVVIKSLEISVNICLYHFLLENYDGGVTDAIPAMATVIVALNATFVFYACLVTFSERSARNSEKLVMLLKKGLRDGSSSASLSSRMDLSALDKPPMEDSDFVLFMKEYRKRPSLYRRKN